MALKKTKTDGKRKQMGTAKRQNVYLSALEMYKEGASVPAVAKKLGISVQYAGGIRKSIQERIRRYTEKGFIEDVIQQSWDTMRAGMPDPERFDDVVDIERERSIAAIRYMEAKIAATVAKGLGVLVPTERLQVEGRLSLPERLNKGRERAKVAASDSE